MATAVDEFCLGIIGGESLPEKLARPGALIGAETLNVSASAPTRPGRGPGLELSGGAERLPRPGALRNPEARALCLARFAHHELMAVELFAWAVLRFPEAPLDLRREWLRILAEEQRHCELYLERLAALGASFTDFAPHSDYFWRQLPAIDGSPAGAAAFLAAMGLTLEQANLDFTRVYADGFREAGDEASARVCDRVHRDEQRHVGAAAEWLAVLDPESASEIARYQKAVPFPLAASRAKGRRFDVGARREAGLGEEFIEFVRNARSAQETGRTPE